MTINQENKSKPESFNKSWEILEYTKSKILKAFKMSNMNVFIQLPRTVYIFQVLANSLMLTLI